LSPCEDARKDPQVFRDKDFEEEQIWEEEKKKEGDGKSPEQQEQANRIG
jgi:hypothetical protein